MSSTKRRTRRTSVTTLTTSATGMRKARRTLLETEMKMMRTTSGGTRSSSIDEGLTLDATSLGSHCHDYHMAEVPDRRGEFRAEEKPTTAPKEPRTELVFTQKPSSCSGCRESAAH
eukprot:4007479-Heterocapsa_arctica.AAC.1